MRIIGIPPRSLIDEALSPLVLGVPAGAKIDVSLNLRAHRSVDWSSNAVFRADASGVVNLARDAPLLGTYTQADASGLWWSAEPIGATPRTDAHETDPILAELHVSTAGQPPQSVTFERISVGPGVCRVDLDGGGLEGAFLSPPTRSPRTSVLLLAGSSGGASVREAALLASRGFPALALGYFSYRSRPSRLCRQPLEYFAEALRWLQHRPECNGFGTVAVGHSRGGELALLLAATYPEVCGVVSLAGSGVVWGAIDAAASDEPAWTLHGQPVPHARLTLADIKSTLTSFSGPFAYAAAFRAALERHMGDAACIPVERIAGPLLLLSGSDDAVWPSEEFATMVMERLHSRGFPYARSHVVLAGAGHAIDTAPNLPSVTSMTHRLIPIDLALGGTREANGVASRTAWNLILQFLESTSERQSPSQDCHALAGV